MGLGLLKTELRKLVREEISALPHDYIAESDKFLTSNATTLEEFVAARNIMIYHSVEKEPGTLGIARAAFQLGKTVAFPFCFKGGIMQARVVASLDELKPAMLGIPAPPDSAPVIQPEMLDLIIVPALAYDMAGFRLGYGGGYYDRYLCHTQAYTIGLTRERLLKSSLPIEPHDIAVKCVITEERILCLTNPTMN